MQLNKMAVPMQKTSSRERLFGKGVSSRLNERVSHMQNSGHHRSGEFDKSPLDSVHLSSQASHELKPTTQTVVFQPLGIREIQLPDSVVRKMNTRE